MLAKGDGRTDSQDKRSEEGSERCTDFRERGGAEKESGGEGVGRVREGEGARDGGKDVVEEWGRRRSKKERAMGGCGQGP